MKAGVLLTGAASLVGAEVLRELLQRTDIVRIFLLVPQTEAERRQQMEQLESYLGPLPSSVQPVAGDARLPSFGLAPDEWQKLAASIDIGLHCAQREILDRNLQSARQANVKPVENWIQLLALNPELRLHHLSTAFIGGTRHGLFTEFDLDCGQGFHNAWEKSKFEAEMRLRESRVSERVTIYRTSHVLGCAASGDAFELGGSYPILAVLAHSMIAPGDADARLDFVPADYVATAIVRLACSGARGTFHLAGGWQNSLSVSHAAEIAARSRGRPRKVLIMPGGIAWPLRVFGAPGGKGFHKLSFSIARDIFHQGPVFDTFLAGQSLAAFSMHCPKAESWLEMVAARAEARSWTAPASRVLDKPIEIAADSAAAAEFSLIQKDPVFCEKHFQRIGEVNVAYRDIGQGEPVVFLHGFAGACSWRGVAQRMARTHRAIVIETLGLGDTEAPETADFRLTAQAALVRGLLSTLDLPSAHLVGNGIGGVIAQAFAVRWPYCARSLVLSNCGFENTWPSVRAKRLARLLRLPGAMSIAPSFVTIPMLARSRIGLGSMIHDKRLLTRERLAFYRKELLGNKDRRMRWKHLVRTLTKADIASLDHQLQELDLPTMIVWGAEDTYHSASWAKRLYDLIPGARRLELIPFAASSCHEEQPEIFAQLLGSFLEETTKTKDVSNDSHAVPAAEKTVAYQSNGTSALTSRVYIS